MPDRAGWVKAWTAFSWTLLVASIFGWPVSALTFARGEPQTVLGLSWAAMIVGALGNLTTVYVFRKVDDDLDD